MIALSVLTLGACSPTSDKAPSVTAETGSPDTGEPSRTDCDARVPEDHATPAAALLEAAEGSRVCVAAGTWTGSLDWQGRGVMLVGAGLDQTTIAGDVDGPVASFANGEGPEAGLEDLSVRDGDADSGAGVRVLAGASPTLTRVALRSNHCLGDEPTVRGVGLYAEGGTFTDVEVKGTTCALEGDADTRIYGLGAYVRDAAQVDGLVVRDNFGAAAEYTGAVVAKDLQTTLRRVVVTGNVGGATHLCVGGGLHLSGTTAAAELLDLRDNQCLSGSTARGGGLHVLVEGALSLRNVLVAGNIAQGEVVEGAGARLSGQIELVNGDLVGNVARAPTVSGAALFLADGAQSLRNLATQLNRAEDATTATDVDGAATVTWGWCAWDEDLVVGGALPARDAADGHLFGEPGYQDISGEDPTGWDLRLADGSTHIDAGDPSVLDEDGSTSDIGGYGGPMGGSW